MRAFSRYRDSWPINKDMSDQPRKTQYPKASNIRMFLLLSVLFLSSVSFLFADRSAFAEPYDSTQSGTNRVEYEPYALFGSYYEVPSAGNSNNSQNFAGYRIYEYFYPANPAKNDDKRKALYSFNADGSLYVSNNLVVNGDKTIMNNEYPGTTMGISSVNQTPGQDPNVRTHVAMNPNSDDVRMDGKALVNKQWNKDDPSGLGPSVFLNPDSAKIERRVDNYLSSTKKDMIIETNFSKEEATYHWYEYLETGGGFKQLQSPSAFEITRNTEGQIIALIADAGNRRIAGYNFQTDAFTALGKADWDWLLNGIDTDSRGHIFVTDMSRDIVIRTDMTGQDWKESHRDIDQYQSRLYLEGSERYKTIDPRGVSSNYGRFEAEYPQAYANVNPSAGSALYAVLYDCGYNAHEVIISGGYEYDRSKQDGDASTKPYGDEYVRDDSLQKHGRGFIDIDPNSQKPLMLASEGCAFGEGCFDFSGWEYLNVGDSPAWNFGADLFTMDLWVKFDEIKHAQTIFSHPGSFFLELNYKPDSGETSLAFGFINADRGADNSFDFQSYENPWAPEAGEWYHLSVLRNEASELQMFVDGEQLGASVPITGTLRDADTLLQIGAYDGQKRFKGMMDEIRIARGKDWRIDYTGYYQFVDPYGIVVVPDAEGVENLYVVDSGQGRIVKMNTEFEGWSTFGSPGSGEFQFNHPTDIYYYDGFFYITDTGNSRVVKTDIAEMVHYLKGESGGSWEVVYSSDSPRLTGVMADAGGVIVTDSYNGQIIKYGVAIGSKNPWDLMMRFTSPVDILPAAEAGIYYVLDGTSNFDFSAHVQNRALDLYGSAQKEQINTRFNEGGLLTDKIKTQGVISRLNYADWYSWVGDEQGPPVAHCPEKANEAEVFGACSGGQWTGVGQNVDCTDPAKAPPTECVGQWDWEIYWPYCTQYVPHYEIVQVCVAFEQCTKPDPIDPTKTITYNCGCARYEYDCFSYCQPVNHSCHEGFAVAYKYFEAGPPQWYLDRFNN